MNNRIKVIGATDYIFCLLLALAMVAAPNYIESGSCDFSSSYLVTVLVVFFVLSVINYFVRRLIVRNIISPVYIGEFNGLFNAWNKILHSKHNLWLFFVIILLFWLPIVIALYPGTLINDTWGQLAQFIQYFYKGNHDGVFSNHHPIFDTLIMGAIITPFGEKLDNWQLGFFVYSFVQELLTAFSFSLTIYYAHRYLKVKSGYVLAMLLFYTLCPIFPISAQTISKDALFSWIYVIFIILFIEALRTQGRVFSNFKYDNLLGLFAILCIITKSVGIYIVTFSLVAVCLFIPKYRKYSIATLVCSVVIALGLLTGVKRTLNVAPSGKQEMFSVPFQQTARYFKYHSKDVTKAEFNSINVLLDGKNIGKVYNPTNADPVKGYTDRGNYKQYKNYLVSWFKEGRRHPRTYIAAFNAMVSGWFSFAEYDPLMSMDWHNLLDPKLIPTSAAVRQGEFRKSSQAVQTVFDNLYKSPILQLLLSYGLYASVLPLFITATFLRKWGLEEVKFYWLSVIPLGLSILLGCWLAPVSTLFEGRRYLYPVVYTIPLMLSLCLSIYQIKYGRRE